MIPGWFSRFVRNLRCQQDNTYLANPAYRYHGRHWLALGRCPQGHWLLVIGLSRLTPEIAGDLIKEAAEAKNVWGEACFGIACQNCAHNRFVDFSFDHVLPGRALVFQRCERCRTVCYLPMFWVYREQSSPITPDDVLDASDLLEGTGKNPGVKKMEELWKILTGKRKKA